MFFLYKPLTNVIWYRTLGILGMDLASVIKLASNLKLWQWSSSHLVGLTFYGGPSEVIPPTRTVILDFQSGTQEVYTLRCSKAPSHAFDFVDYQS